MSGSKNVVFDVVGTIFSYDNLFDAIDTRFGDRLRAAGIQPKLLGCCWLETAEREYTYLSLSGRYLPFVKVVEGLFYRMLLYGGIEEPRKFASPDDLAYIMAEWHKLKPRPGAAECISKLRDAGFTVWCFTAGDIKRVGGYFAQAGVDMPAENLLSCDTAGVAKPQPEAYAPVLKKLSADGKTPWFAAAHMWDVSTARTVGFRGAYCSVLEGEPLHDIFGEMDVVAETLSAMADKIIEASNTSRSQKCPFLVKMPPSKLPVANSTVSFWRSKPEAIDNHRSTPELPGTIDIAIIGAGYAGSSTAYHLLKGCEERETAAPSILILEARQACSGATGRNGGHLKPDPYNGPGVVAEVYGPAAGAELAAFEAAHVPAVKKVVEEERVQCDFVLTRCCDVALSDLASKRMRDRYERMSQYGAPHMKDVFLTEGSEAEQHSGVKGALSCITYTAGSIWPYKFIVHLLRKAVEAGVNLQTHTPVTSVTAEADADGFFVVTTDRGSVKARKVVFATNGYTSSVLPEFSEKIVPVRGICSHIVSDKTPSPLLSNSYILRWSPTRYEYLIPRLDGSIIVGGAREKYWHDLDLWYNNVEDDRLIESAKDHFDGYMQTYFHGWENSGAKTAKVWTGIMGYSSDGLPHVGPVPGRQNQFILAGFTGHGMPQVFLSAKGIAQMILDGAEFSKIGVPRIFEASKTRLESSKNAILENWRASKLQAT
ncbi:DAO-domain-containing protein [Thozetella sp. PMI_491]|nr:DAO-domain-containing protein [Thozetella sp. PMI_491]